MHILYVAPKYDYGKPEQGTSFEHANFYDALLNMGHDILYFDFMMLHQQLGKERMNRRLREVAQAEKPDLMFTVVFRDELDQDTIRGISALGDTLTVNWFTDDHWRFDNFSRHWAPCFNWSITTATSALPKYEAIGYHSVIKSQWACNHFLYRKLGLPYRHDVTFVGQPHGNRPHVIQALRDAQIDVKTWGTGWGSGRLTQEELIEVFNTSRINLNLSNASTSASQETPSHLRQSISYILRTLPGGQQMKSAVRGLALRLGGAQHSLSGSGDQIKGRNFEVPGCGSLMLTGQADNLGDYYLCDREIVCFERVGELIEKIRYYLSHESEREAIAEAGYQRTLNEHTYAHRFRQIFHTMGLPVEPLRGPASLTPAPGRVDEIAQGTDDHDLA